MMYTNDLYASGNYVCGRDADKIPFYVAKCLESDTTTIEEACQYAQVFAAAPELLEACEAIMQAVNDDPSLQEELVIAYFGEVGPVASALQKTIAALAKARGTAQEE